MVRTNKGARYPAAPVLPALRSDIPRLVDLWIDAVRPDLLARVELEGISEEKIKEYWTNFMDLHFDKPEVIIMKGVDYHDNDQIAAVAVWIKRGYSAKELGVDLNSNSGVGQADKGTRSSSHFRLCGGRLLSGNAMDELRSPIVGYINEQEKKFYDYWATDMKYIDLGLLMTDPRFQRRGHGTRLLKWGHELADREAVVCFLGATPFGYPLYENLGWRHVGATIVLDLKEWVKYAEKGDMGWGVYKMRGMMRLPRIYVEKK
jgi:GNAT superfamily N-acetyltransferase